MTRLRIILNQIIKETIISERYDINNIPKNIILLSDEDRYKFFLFDTIKKEVIAFIVFSSQYGVDRVYTKIDGYGAFLYECAMTSLYPNGLSMSKDGDTSDAALGVWDKFYHRTDVRKERKFSDKNNYNRETFPTKAKYKDSPELLKHILELEDTEFFYSFGKEKLDNMIERGKQYMDEHGIYDVDGLETNMEFDD